MNAQPLPSNAGQNRREPRPRVLIVEPDPLTMWSLVNHLARRFAVHSTPNGGWATEFLEREPIDRLILSSALPEVDLLRLDELARARQPGVRTVLLVTARDSVALPHAVKVEKPFELDDLARALEAGDWERHSA